MSVIKQAFTEIIQSYKLIYQPIIRNWRIRSAIKVANSEFLRTGKQYFVLKHPEHDCEVLSKTQIDVRIMMVKKNDKRFKNQSIVDIQKNAIYMTPAKIYSGNLNAFGIKQNGSVKPKVKSASLKFKEVIGSYLTALHNTFKYLGFAK